LGKKENFKGKNDGIINLNYDTLNYNEITKLFIANISELLKLDEERDLTSKKLLRLMDKLAFKSRFLGNIANLFENIAITMFRPLMDFDDCCSCCYKANNELNPQLLTEYGNAMRKFLQTTYDSQKHTLFPLCKDCFAYLLGSNSNSTPYGQNKVITIKQTNDTLPCVVCEDSPRIIHLLPCNHFILCEKCSSSVEECPICRSKIVNRIKTYT